MRCQGGSYSGAGNRCQLILGVVRPRATRSIPRNHVWDGTSPRHPPIRKLVVRFMSGQQKNRVVEPPCLYG
jgi:hypothetical protein